MKLLIGILLILHGLIVAAQSAGSFKPMAGAPNPTWLNWWPTTLGQSWLLSKLGLERTLITWLGGLLWLAGGVALVAAGLGVLGLRIPADGWRSLAVGGAAISFFMLLIYLHPLFAIGIGADIAILVALLWAHWSPT